MQPSNVSERLIFYPSTLPLRCSFTTHKHAHMRTCSLYRRAPMCAYFSHRHTRERACSQNRRVLGHTCQTQRRALERACSPHRHAMERACSPHRHALMHACPPHRCAPRAHLKFPLTCTNARLFSVQTRTYARLPLNRPCMWAHTLPKNPSKPLYGPPYLPCPKIGNLSLCRMIRPLT
jgi:hypothetical protein